jgi:hypothetical protein
MDRKVNPVNVRLHVDVVRVTLLPIDMLTPNLRSHGQLYMAVSLQPSLPIALSKRMVSSEREIDKAD